MSRWVTTFKRAMRSRAVRYPLGRHLVSMTDRVRSRLSTATDPIRTCITLTPRATLRGNVLFSYLPEPFLPDAGRLIEAHPHFWQVRAIAEMLLDMGYSVDVIRFNNAEFVPKKPYDVLIDARTNLERLAPLLGQRCTKIMHADTAHWLFHMTAQHLRLSALLERRGVALPLRKIVAPNRGIEVADHATMLGNDFSMSTYRYAGTPMYRIPNSVSPLHDWIDDKNFEACRRRFLWLGSEGLVHKGLDLTLEAFAGMPDCHLTVCGPLDAEPEFVQAYRKELYETPNITTVGWIDIAGPTFHNVVRSCVGNVYPSCSEGSSGAVITSLHAGLVPVVSRESGVDVDERLGALLRRCTIQEIRETVQQLAGRPAGDLRDMSRSSWEFARANHVHERFTEEYRRVLEHILGTGA